MLNSVYVNIEYVCMLVSLKNYVLFQFWGENGPYFKKISTKLRNEALIRNSVGTKVKGN